jgi:ATP/maltotriose-dependent transcriptional regulator MalT
MPVAQPAALTPAAFTRFGDLLRFLRRRAQLTQRDLGIAVGYNFAQICRLEQGQRLPDPSVVAAVFVPALGLEEAPELAARLIELAGAARQERQEATLAALAPTPEASETDALEAIPTPAPYEVPRPRLVARLHARLVAERRVALVGLAGMGKTTLAAALAREYAQATPVFWLTLTSGVTTSVEAVIRHLVLFLAAHGQGQARALLHGAGQGAETLTLDRQLSAIAAALGQLARQSGSQRGTPPLLCLDNAHLVQEDDDVIHMLLHLCATTPARMLLTSREQIQALPGWPHVRLAGLDMEEGLELIAQLAPDTNRPTEPPAWALGLLEKSGGSPMLLQLALGELADRRIEPATLIAGLESQPQIASYLLETVRRHTSATAWGLLAMISVFRQPINLHDPALIELIQEADTPYDLGAALDELIRRHLIDHPTQAQTHPLVRDYAYAGLLRLPLHRRQLHRIAAEWSEQGLDDAVEAGYHYGQAGDLAAATAVLADNVEAVRRRGVNFAAADVADSVLIQARRQRGEPADTVVRLLTLRGDLLMHSLRAQEAEASYREALQYTKTTAERARIACRLAESLTQRGQAAEAVRLCQEAQAQLDQGELVLRAQLRAAESQAHLALTNYGPATAAANQALALADQAGGAHVRQATEIRVRAYRVLGAVARYTLDLDTALVHMQNASRTADQMGLTELASRCHMDEATLLFLQGRVGAAIERCAEILPRLRASGDSYTIGQIYSILTLSYLLHDELSAGLAAAEQAYAVREAIGDRRGLVMAANQRALLLIAMGRHTEAQALVAGILALGDLTGEMYELGFALEKLAILQMLDGDGVAAQATLHRALGLPATAGDMKLRGDLTDDLVVALLMAGATDEAQALLEQQREDGGRWIELDRQLLAALIALARGDQPAAQAAAAELASRAGAVGLSLYERKAKQIANATPPHNFPRLAWVMDAR